jgi:hypothetical protein
MPTYKKLGDVIQDQLFSYQDANKLQDSISAILTGAFAEDGLFDSGVDMAIRGIRMNAAADGGRIEFDGNAAKYLEVNSAGNEMKLVGLDLNMDPPDYVYGDRSSLMFQRSVSTNEPFSTTNSVTYPGGYAMPSPGSILSLSHSYYSITRSGVGTAAAVARLYKNGSLWFSGTATADMTAATRYGNVDIYARGAYTFAQGDRIEALHGSNQDGFGPIWTGISVINVEVIYDY